MNGHVDKHEIKDVDCRVTNCQFHDGEKKCCAGHISVGPNHALTSKDTICGTFKCK